MPPRQIPQLSQGYVSGDGFDFAESCNKRQVSTPAGVVGNSIYLAKVRFPRALRITTMSWYVGVAAGTIDAGLYDSADAGVNLSRVGSTGNIAVAGASLVQSAALTAPVVVSPGKDYWIAIQASTGTTLTLGRFGTQAGLLFDQLETAIFATTTGLPTTITGHSTTTNVVWVRAS
jgi:hypothetical protein